MLRRMESEIKSFEKYQICVNGEETTLYSGEIVYRDTETGKWFRKGFISVGSRESEELEKMYKMMSKKAASN